MSGQENFPEELNEMETNNLSDIEFGVMIIILNRMKKGIHHKKGPSQSEIKNAILEINYILEGINSKLEDTDDQISDLESVTR